MLLQDKLEVVIIFFEIHFQKCVAKLQNVSQVD